MCSAPAACAVRCLPGRARRGYWVTRKQMTARLHRSRGPRACYPVAAVDDPNDELGVERAWVRRMTRRLAQEHGWERARARAEAAVELAAARAGIPERTEPCRVGPGGVRVTAARLAQLDKVRAVGGHNAWRGVDAATRSVMMARRVRCRWARTSGEERHAVAVALNPARWHRLDLAKVAPGGGVYK